MPRRDIHARMQTEHTNSTPATSDPADSQPHASLHRDTNELRWLYGKAYDAPIALGTFPPFAHAYERYDVSLMACAICTGPVLLRRENIKNIDDLQIETWVNDVLVQVGNASGVKTRTGTPPSHARLT